VVLTRTHGVRRKLNQPFHRLFLNKLPILEQCCLWTSSTQPRSDPSVIASGAVDPPSCAAFVVLPLDKLPFSKQLLVAVCFLFCFVARTVHKTTPFPKNNNNSFPDSNSSSKMSSVVMKGSRVVKCMTRTSYINSFVRNSSQPAGNSTMKALVYGGPNKKAWQEMPKPTILEAGDAIIKITTTTLCGTDLHILKGDGKQYIFQVNRVYIFNQ
jgi:hypothetical protein